MEYVKTFEKFIQNAQAASLIKDKFGNEYNYHYVLTKHEYRLTVNKNQKILAFIKLEHDFTENFWEIEEVDINERYRRHGFYISIIIESLKILNNNGFKGIVSRKYPVHKEGQRSNIMDTFWENTYNEQNSKDIIITKKEAAPDKEGWDYYIQSKH